MDPPGSRDLDVLDADPGAAVTDQFCLKQGVQGLGQCIVVGIAFRSDLGDSVLLGESLAIADSPILDSSIGVMDQPGQVVPIAPSQVDAHFQRFQSKIGVQGLADLPAHDLAIEHVGHERDVDPAGERVDIGDVRDPQPVRRERGEVKIHQVLWALLARG